MKPETVPPITAPTYPPYEPDPISISFMEYDLARSGLVPEDLGAYPITPGAFRQAPAYCIPYHHNPLMYRTRIKRDDNKYIGPAGVTDVWLPLQVTPDQLKEAQTLWIIEGEKKAAKFHKHFNLPTIGIGGCWNYAESSTNEAPILLPLLLHVLAQTKHVKVVFDADIHTTPHVQKAARRLADMLKALRCELTVYTIPQRVTTKAHGVTSIAPIKGMDDWLVADPAVTLNDLEAVNLNEMSRSLQQAYLRLGCKPDKKNQPQPIEFNAQLLIQELNPTQLWADPYRGLCYRTHTNELLNQPDEISVELLSQLQDYCNTAFKVSHVRNALLRLERTLPTRNPVTEWLRTLKWDQEPRLCTWASATLTSPSMGADYINEWGRLLISAIVHRTVRPGCQQDYAFILSGPQGIGKTTLFRALGHLNHENYYIEYTPAGRLGGDGEQRTQGAIFRRHIVVDFSEGVLLKKYSAEEVKSIITRREDAFRKMFTTDMTTIPRHAVCVGTTNQADLLHDSSGGRRFVILEVSHIQHLTEAYIEQLYAEAYHKREEFMTATWHHIIAETPTNDSGLISHDAQSAYNLGFQQTNDGFDVLVEYLNSNQYGATANGIPTYHRQELHNILVNGGVNLNTSGINAALRRVYTDVRFPFETTQARVGFTHFKFTSDFTRSIYENHRNHGDNTVRVFQFKRKK